VDDFRRRKSNGIVAGASKGKPKLPTARTIRTEGGCKITVDGRKEVDDAVIVRALREVLASLDPDVSDWRAA
jgi:hypothetical protein